MISTVDMISAL